MPWPNSLMLLCGDGLGHPASAAGGRRDHRAAAAPVAAGPRARHPRPDQRGPARRTAHGELEPGRVRRPGRALHQARQDPRRAAGDPGSWPGRAAPISYAGEHFAFEDISLSPRAYRPDGPRLWFGGQGVSPAAAAPTGALRPRVPPGRRVDRPRTSASCPPAWPQAGRDIADLELVGGTRAVFPDDESMADIGAAMEPIREQIEAGFTTFCVKPSQFIDDVGELPAFCRDVVRRAEAMTVLTVAGTRSYVYRSYPNDLDCPRRAQRWPSTSPSR